MRRPLALLVVCTVGCASQRIHAPPASIGVAAAELRANGRAGVAARAWEPASAGHPITRDVRLDDMVQTRFADRAFEPGRPPRQIRYDDTLVAVPVRELLAGCPAGPIRNDEATRLAYPACRLLRVHGDVHLGERRRIDAASVITVGALAGVGGMITCAIACDSPYQDVSIGGLVVIGAATIGLAVFVYAIAKTARD